MASFLHTMVRITDPGRRRARSGAPARPPAPPARAAFVCAALRSRFSRDRDIVREGEVEATNYFFSIGDQENVLELTFNHDGRSQDVGTGSGTGAIRADDPRGHPPAL